jgi:phage pi2 protein 07
MFGAFWSHNVEGFQSSFKVILESGMDINIWILDSFQNKFHRFAFLWFVGCVLDLDWPAQNSGPCHIKPSVRFPSGKRTRSHRGKVIYKPQTRNIWRFSFAKMMRIICTLFFLFADDFWWIWARDDYFTRAMVKAWSKHSLFSHKGVISMWTRVNIP